MALPEKKNRIVVVSPIPLMPVSGGGAARIIAYMDFLRSVGYKVELVTVRHTKKDILMLSKHLDGLYMLRGKLDLLRSVFILLPDWLKSRIRQLRGGVKPLEAMLFPKDIFPNFRLTGDSFIGRMRNEAFDKFARDIAIQLRPCAVIANFVWTARSLEGVPNGTLTILDTIDVQHLRNEIAINSGHDLVRTYCTREEEARELNRASILMAIQPGELEVLREMCPDKKCILVEHSHPIPTKLIPSPKSSAQVLFVGNSYEPNIIGINDFIVTVWPKILLAVPKAELIICGKVCESAQKGKGVKLMGVVPDMLPYYQGAAVVINPVPFGSGLKIKSVEALTQGRCLVATPAGALGLPAACDTFSVVGDLESMPNSIIHLLTDYAARSEMENNAYAFAKQYYNPQRVYADLLNAIQEHIGDL